MKNFWAAIGASAIAAFSVSAANATVYSDGDAGFLAGFTTDPSDWVAAYYSSQSNVDVGAQSPGNVETVIEGASWVNMDVSFVGGGACGDNVFQNGCSADEDTKSGESQLEGNVFAVHFDNQFLVFVYESVINDFSISGLPNGVSNIYVFNKVGDVPLPAAIWLMGAGLAGLGFSSRKKKTA